MWFCRHDGASRVYLSKTSPAGFDLNGQGLGRDLTNKIIFGPNPARYTFLAIL
jgi:hypothetical protein